MLDMREKMCVQTEHKHRNTCETELFFCPDRLNPAF